MSDGKIIKFPRDSIIIREGETNPDMYKIVQGNAELYTGYGTDKELLLGIVNICQGRNNAEMRHWVV